MYFEPTFLPLEQAAFRRRCAGLELRRSRNDQRCPASLPPSTAQRLAIRESKTRFDEKQRGLALAGEPSPPPLSGDMEWASAVLADVSDPVQRRKTTPGGYEPVLGMEMHRYQASQSGGLNHRETESDKAEAPGITIHSEYNAGRYRYCAQGVMKDSFRARDLRWKDSSNIAQADNIAAKRELSAGSRWRCQDAQIATLRTEG